ncbi:hypothetical protein V6N13_092035 [Hibiscus sabdariffa]
MAFALELVRSKGSSEIDGSASVHSKIGVAHSMSRAPLLELDAASVVAWPDMAVHVDSKIGVAHSMSRAPLSELDAASVRLMALSYCTVAAGAAKFAKVVAWLDMAVHVDSAGSCHCCLCNQPNRLSRTGISVVRLT